MIFKEAVATKLRTEWDDQLAAYIYVLCDESGNQMERGSRDWAERIGRHYDLVVPEEPVDAAK